MFLQRSGKSWKSEEILETNSYDRHMDLKEQKSVVLYTLPTVKTRFMRTMIMQH